MKKLLLILAISLLFSCDKNDDKETNGLVGNWNKKEIRIQNINQDWSEWEPIIDIEKSIYFVDDINVKLINYDNTEILGTYTYNDATKILNTTFPSLDFPNNTLTLISMENNQMVLQKGDNHANTLSQIKYIKDNN